MEEFDFEPVEILVANAVKKHLFPCAALSVALDGVILYRCWYGAKTYAPWIGKIGSDAVFDLASLTKPLVTAISFMLLTDNGVLDLNEKIPAFFEQVPGDKADISIKHLLSHASGICAHESFYHGKYASELAAHANRIDLACRLILAMPLAVRPGTRNIYSDLGYILLGHIIEKITGQAPFDFAMQEVFKPLGIEGFFWSEDPALSWKQVVPSGFCQTRNRC
ncbi:MAG: hypothetical protein DSZ23_04635, partial [Thermodesulfatator sp.]